MQIVKVIGIIAIIVFLVAYIGEKAISWFAEPGDIINTIVRILGYIATGAFSIGASCGIISLFS